MTLCYHIVYPALLCVKVKVKIGKICKVKILHRFLFSILVCKGNRFFINSYTSAIFFYYFIKYSQPDKRYTPHMPLKR